MTVSQKNAVFTAITSVIGSDLEHRRPIKLQGSEKLAVVTALTEGFKHGEIVLSEAAHDKYIRNASDDSALRKYVGSLINNWCRKDTRLNADGQPYETKNPGSRNTAISNMRKLQKRFEEGTNEFMQIQAKIDEKLAESKVKESKAKPIDYSSIPSDLLDSLGLSGE
mgnify:CR=1 FL=1